VSSVNLLCERLPFPSENLAYLVTSAQRHGSALVIARGVLFFGKAGKLLDPYAQTIPGISGQRVVFTVVKPTDSQHLGK